jgi:hypothetical protein
MTGFEWLVTALALTAAKAGVDYYMASRKEAKMDKRVADRDALANKQTALFQKESQRKLNVAARHRIALRHSFLATTGQDTESGRARISTQGSRSSLAGATSYLEETAVASRNLRDAESRVEQESYATPGLASVMLGAGLEIGASALGAKAVEAPFTEGGYLLGDWAGKMRV